MRSSNISGRFERAALLAALACGCSTTPSGTNDAAAPACSMTFTGNVTDEGSAQTCATVTASDAGSGWVLSIDTTTTAIARVVATVALGDTPSTGQITNETVTDWSAVALESSSSCFFQAGATSVPAGTLDLDAIDPTTATAHGTLTIVAYVHAPPTIDCSYGDIETITIHF